VSLRILVAEDEGITLKHLTYALTQEGYAVTGVDNGGEALRRVEQGSYDLIIADIKMPGLDGLALLAEVKARFPEIDVFIVTGFGSVESAVEAMKRGALDYLTKPYNLDELLLKVRRVAEKKRLGVENAALKVSLGLGRDRPFIAKSRAMRRIAELIREIRDSDCNVLITGESGVGKGLVARLIHETGPRSASRSFRSTAPCSPRSCSQANSSAMKRAPSRGPSSRNAASWKSRTGGPSFSTRSRKCRRISRQNSSR